MSGTDTLPPCPNCGGTLRLELRLQATNGLIGGSQPKVAVRQWPYLVCDCGFAEAGKR
jgi:hypothetical protein